MRVFHVSGADNAAPGTTAADGASSAGLYVGTSAPFSPVSFGSARAVRHRCQALQGPWKQVAPPDTHAPTGKQQRGLEGDRERSEQI